MVLCPASPSKGLLIVARSPPLVYPGGSRLDTVSRLAYPGRLLLAHQPPGLQATLYLLSRVSDDPLLARYGMAAVGALAGLGFYYLARDLDLRPTAAFRFVTHPYILSLSTVPYNEILMLGPSPSPSPFTSSAAPGRRPPSWPSPA
jgi:hypothetical protein